LAFLTSKKIVICTLVNDRHITIWQQIDNTANRFLRNGRYVTFNRLKYLNVTATAKSQFYQKKNRRKYLSRHVFVEEANHAWWNEFLIEIWSKEKNFLSSLLIFMQMRGNKTNCFVTSASGLKFTKLREANLL